MRAPSCRSASTKSPIGRSCMRATPDNSYSPPASASTAVSGRNAVPALPKNNLAALTGNIPPQPVITKVCVSRCSTATPSACSASSMRAVSSDNSTSRISVVPLASAASSRVRLEMLLEPGRFTLPCAVSSGGISRKSNLFILSQSLKPARQPRRTQRAR